MRYAQSKGLSLKVSDEFTVPLCAIHHHRIHTTGEERGWWRERNIDPLVVAGALWRQSTERRPVASEDAQASERDYKIRRVGYCTRSRPKRKSRTIEPSVMVENATGTVAFFQAMASVLIANLLTVAFVYSFVKIHQKELTGAEEGRLTYLWLIILVLLFMLYGLYTWGVYSLSSR